MYLFSGIFRLLVNHRPRLLITMWCGYFWAKAAYQKCTLYYIQLCPTRKGTLFLHKRGPFNPIWHGLWKKEKWPSLAPLVFRKKRTSESLVGFQKVTIYGSFKNFGKLQWKNAISKAQQGNKISPFTVQNKVKTWLGRCRPAAKTVVPKCNELESL